MRQSDERVNSFQHKIPVNDNSALFSRISYRLCQDVRLVLVRLSGPATLLHLDHLLVLVNQVFQAVLDRLWHPFVQVFQEFQVVLSTTTTIEPVLFPVVHVTFTTSFDYDRCLINRPSFSCIKNRENCVYFAEKWIVEKQNGLQICSSDPHVCNVFLYSWSETRTKIRRLQH